MPLEQDSGILKDFYIPSDGRAVKDLFITTRKTKAKRKVLDFLQQDDEKDEMRIRRLLTRVRKLRLLAKRMAEVG
ncbi:MAG: hypothetical protein QW420_06960 [Candidatus Caldarchaeum sp.]